MNRPVAAVALALLLASGCSRAAAPSLGAPGSQRGANVLLVTIDTLRQDRVGAYGSTSALTPTLDRLAAGGVRYAHAFSHVPMTLPSHTSILTGLTPPRHGVRNNTTFRLADGVPTLATLLKQAGYRTGAVVGAFVLDAGFGLARGFDEYDDRMPRPSGVSLDVAERRGDEVVAHAAEWILRAAPLRSPWFAWVHLYDPHAPYDAPPEYRAGRAPYDAEVAYADAMLGHLLDRLRSANALDRTLVVVVGDHGESLGEHGEATHGLFAYDATLAVPLIVSGPGVGAGRVDAAVAESDLLPSILDLVGLQVPDGLDGRSLVRPLSSERPIYFEAFDAYLTRGWAPLRGIIQGGWKYVDLPLPELYDLALDPHEQQNRFAANDHANALRRLLTTEFPDRPVGTATSSRLDVDALGRMRSLGYVGGTAATPQRRVTEADDPKRLVALNERFNTAVTAYEERRAAEALAGFQAILTERPDFLSARTLAATVLIVGGRAREAVTLLRAAPPDQAQLPELLAKLGTALHEAGDPAGAVRALEQARLAGNRSADVLNELAVVYSSLGRADAARAAFRELLADSPDTQTAWYNLGLFELGHQRPNDAAAALRRAVDIDPSYGEAWAALGAALLKANPHGAIDAWRRAEPLLPHDYDLLFNLGMSLESSDTPGDALPYLRRFAVEAPRDRYAADIARVQAVIARLERAGR